MKFLVDAQLPPALAQWLRNAGHEADHVQELQLLTADDRVIWTHAQGVGAVIVTKDEDFAIKSAQTSEGPIIVWLRVGNTSNQTLRLWFELRLPGVVQLISEGNRLIEVI